MPQAVMNASTADELGLMGDSAEVSVTLVHQQKIHISHITVYADFDGDLAIAMGDAPKIYLSKHDALQLRDLITAMDEAGLLS